MQPLTLLVAISLISTVLGMALFAPNEISYEPMVDDSESGYLLFAKLFNPSNPEAKSRTQRSHQKTCGQKILEYTIKVCGTTASTHGTEIDISTKCCSTRCTDDFIRMAMCPDKNL